MLSARRFIGHGRDIGIGAILGVSIVSATAAHAAHVLDLPCSNQAVPAAAFSGRTVVDPLSKVRVEASNLHFVKVSLSNHPHQVVAVAHIILRNEGKKAFQYYWNDFSFHGLSDQSQYTQGLSDSEVTIAPLDQGLLPPGQSTGGDLVIFVPAAAQNYQLRWLPLDMKDAQFGNANATPYLVVPINR